MYLYEIRIKVFFSPKVSYYFFVKYTRIESIYIVIERDILIFSTVTRILRKVNPLASSRTTGENQYSIDDEQMVLLTGPLTVGRKMAMYK